MGVEVKVSPSIISADMLNLDKEVERLEKSGADMIHVDIYPALLFAFDYSALSRITIGALLIDFLKRRTSLPLDVHASIEATKEIVGRLIDFGADYLTFHPDVAVDPEEIADYIKERGVKLGLAATVHSELNKVKSLSSKADLILIVTTSLNFGGKIRMDIALDKVREMRGFVGENVDISVDGGVNPETAPKYVGAGATTLVAGSYVFKSRDYAEAVKKLKDSCRNI